MTRRFLMTFILCMLSSACSIPQSTASGALASAYRLRERAEVHTALALAYLDQGQAEAGRVEAQRALELAPAHHDALHVLALIALTQGEVEAARGHFEKAFNTESGADDIALRLNYARFLCEHKHAPAGRALLENTPAQSSENTLRIQRLLSEECSK